MLIKYFKYLDFRMLPSRLKPPFTLSTKQINFIRYCNWKRFIYQAYFE